MILTYWCKEDKEVYHMNNALVWSMELSDQLPAVRQCVGFYPLHNMASFVQFATRQHNIDYVLEIIGRELDKKLLPSNEDIIRACVWEKLIEN